MRQRWINGAGFLLCLFALLFAVYYLEKTLALEPCPLCMLDRAMILLIGLTFLLAFVHNPQAWGKKVYAGVRFVLIGIGIGIATRHIWLQNLPADQVPSCGADFDYMWDNWPFGKMLATILEGTGDCAEVRWTLLGLTIPEQVLAFLLLLAIITFFGVRGKA